MQLLSRLAQATMLSECIARNDVDLPVDSGKCANLLIVLAE